MVKKPIELRLWKILSLTGPAILTFHATVQYRMVYDTARDDCGKVTCQCTGLYGTPVSRPGPSSPHNCRCQYGSSVPPSGRLLSSLCLQVRSRIPKKEGEKHVQQATTLNPYQITPTTPELLPPPLHSISTTCYRQQPRDFSH